MTAVNYRQMNEYIGVTGFPRCALSHELRWGERRGQMQRNIQLRASAFTAKIQNERFNVIAEVCQALSPGQGQ